MSVWPEETFARLRYLLGGLRPIETVYLPGQGVLTLDKGAIHYDGSLGRGKMNGKGTVTFKNGDTYTGNFVNGSFSGYGKFKAKDGWTYEGYFVNGQPEGKGTLTTEANVVYKGTFKQGIYQNAH